MNAAAHKRLLGPLEESILRLQKRQYGGSFYRTNRWRWAFRDDCRYRWNRLLEFLAQMGFGIHSRTVYDVGFGTGDLLFLFPTSCRLMGTELSEEAVAAIQMDSRLQSYSDHWFEPVGGDGALPSPPHPPDIVLASHVLEHVPDDRNFLLQALEGCAPGCLIVSFVPLEPPGFDPKHVRTYTLDSLSSLMRSVGLEILHLEANYHICSGPFQWLDYPARHNWPVLQWLEGVRNLAMTLVPYRTTRAIEELLQLCEVGGKQAMVVARIPDQGRGLCQPPAHRRPISSKSAKMRPATAHRNLTGWALAWARSPCP